MVNCRTLLALAALPLSLIVRSPAIAACNRGLPSAGSSKVGQQPLTAADLIELREIGNLSSTGYSEASPLAVSPDGREVAYFLNRADLKTNSYCRTLVVSSTQKPGLPRVLDRGGAPVLIEEPVRGYYLPSGFPDVVTPIWSPDGDAIAYRRRDAGVTRAWVVDVATGKALPISAPGANVEQIAWSAHSKRLIYTVRHGIAAERTAIDEEGQHGWLFDKRVIADVSPRPAIAAATRYDVFAVTLSSGVISAASPSDRARLPDRGQPGYPVDPGAAAPDGRKAWAERSLPSPLAPARLMAIGSDRRAVVCRSPLCLGGILSIWWHDADVFFLRREGWDQEETALYRWSASSSPPVAIFRTRDVLHGCVRNHSALICTRETSITPRRLVSIDLATGKTTELFNPNPDFEKFRLGAVRRLRWRNAAGLETWGDLVLPPGYRPGERLPLIVVQYHSVGFLRGGTGDEYPIFLFAQRGFAVLSIERPNFIASTDPTLTSWDAMNAVNQRNWAERRSLLSAVLVGVSKAVDTGSVDPARVGITGLSDGAATVAFALINSDAFAAAAMSTCCIEPLTTMAIGGIAWADQLRSMGYPPATEQNREFWKDMSLAQNARRIDTPLLMQLSDNEFRLALEAYSALREQGKPVEMYVYPDEFHTKGQPIHRVAVYQRNLDWFSFWLQHREDPDPAKAAEYARWRSMRARRQSPRPQQPKL